MAVTTQVPTYSVKVPKSIKIKNFTLGIAEKPTAAARIATALSPKSTKINIQVTRKSSGKSVKLVPITCHYLEYEQENVFIIPALGHLFTLIQDGYGWQFPVYDFHWVSMSEANGSSFDPKFIERIEATVETFRYFSNKTKKHVVMTDYDEEGEVIGAIILSELVGNQSLKNAKRMRYSSFAKTEIQESFEHTMLKKSDNGLDFGMYNRGLMRHYLDWLWGINLSRALMLSLKNSTGKYYTLSTGRVQGPTLSFVSNRMDEINAFVPYPRFKINLSIDVGKELPLNYETPFVEVLKLAKQIVNDTKNVKAEVKAINSKNSQRKSPVPYNISTLQNDAYNHFKITPTRTLAAAENLYLAAAISYPRTSSEKYPSNLNHKEILTKLSKNTKLKKFITLVRKANKKLKPKEGKKTDPAHPCLYPTGESPSILRGDREKIYKLITARYFATFGDPEKFETTKVEFDINSHLFNTNGRRTLSKGWRALIGDLDKASDNELPVMKVGDRFHVILSEYEKRFTIPPSKFNQSSLLKEMEKSDIGTKATRSEIIKSLMDRKFIRDDPLLITPIGDTINEVLEKYSSQVISVELSRKLEKMGDMIESTINSPIKTDVPFHLSDALVRGITYLHEMLDDLMVNQKEVGLLIEKNLISQRREETIIGSCLSCKTGELKIIRSIRSGKRFVGCSNYFNDKLCDVTFPIPQKGIIQILTESCKSDGYPQLKIIPEFKLDKNGVRKRQTPWTLCLYSECKIMAEFRRQIEERKNAAKKKKRRRKVTSKKTSKGTKTLKKKSVIKKKLLKKKTLNRIKKSTKKKTVRGN